MTDTITAVRAPLSIPLDDVMVDLETLGTRAGCVVVSIGAVKFSPTTGFVDVDNAFYEVVDIDYSMRAGLVAEADTLKWWMAQSDEARAVFSSPDAVSLPAALVRFAEWVSDEGDYGDVKMWGNGAGFDNPILSAAFAAGGIKQPWHHWNDRCYRTKCADYKHLPFVREGVLHNAKDDAVSQAKYLCKVLAEERRVRQLSKIAAHGCSASEGKVPFPVDYVKATKE